MSISATSTSEAPISAQPKVESKTPPKRQYVPVADEQSVAEPR